MGWRKVKSVLHLTGPNQFAIHPSGEVYVHERQNRVTPWSPTTNAADALRLQAECAGKVGDAVRVRKSNGKFGVSSSEVGIIQQADTLELAICYFANQLVANLEHKLKQSIANLRPKK